MMDSDGIEYLAVMRPASVVRATTRLERLSTLDETALLLRKSTRTVRRMLHDGKLGGCKIGGTWRIPESELRRVMAHGLAGGHRDAHRD